MDSKIIASIIIAIALLGGVYLYTKDNAYTRCVTARMDYWVNHSDGDQKVAKALAIEDCAETGMVKDYAK
jgi:hypothetical protein